MHPGGLGVLLDEDVGKLYDPVPVISISRHATRRDLLADFVAGKDATTVFYGLHRSEVLAKPQYQRLKIGQIEGEKQKIRPNLPGEISTVSGNEYIIATLNS